LIAADDRSALLADTLLTLGEVHTGLLLHSSAVSPEVASRLLDTQPGVRVYRCERPISYARSPVTLTGVDCLLPDATGRRVRCIGTVSSQTAITGGRIVQTSTYVTVDSERADPRRPWAHYLARPGRVEAVSRPNTTHLSDGFLYGAATGDRLDLAAIGHRAFDSVQTSDALDHTPPLRSARTRLRWLVDPDGDAPAPATFRVVGDNDRVMRLAAHESDLAAHVEFCEDMALHDWLLTALLTVVERSRIGVSPRDAVVARLAPAIDHLLHLWMPANRVHPELAESWAFLEGRRGLTRQWLLNVERVRDQVALATWERLGPATS
jgi:hypothetical protein